MVFHIRDLYHSENVIVFSDQIGYFDSPVMTGYSIETERSRALPQWTYILFHWHGLNIAFLLVSKPTRGLFKNKYGIGLNGKNSSRAMVRIDKVVSLLSGLLCGQQCGMGILAAYEGWLLLRLTVY